MRECVELLEWGAADWNMGLFDVDALTRSIFALEIVQFAYQSIQPESSARSLTTWRVFQILSLMRSIGLTFSSP